MEGFIVKCCIICGQPTVKSEPRESREVFTGSSGVSLLNDQLCVYFIARKLLKLSRKRCIQFTSHFLSSSSTTWFQTFCNGCGDVVIQALDRHRTLLRLTGEIEELGKTLQLMVRNSGQIANQDGDGVWLEIRQLLKAVGESACDTNFLEGGHYSDNDNDTGWHQGGDNYDSGDVGMDASTGGIDEAATKIQMKTLSKGTSNRDRQRKVSRRNSSDSDSDYEPDRQKRQKSFKKKKTDTRLVEKTDGGYQCELCQSFYTTPHGYKKHMQAHEESRILGGKYDLHPNLSEEKLRRHLTKIHETVKNTCNICGYFAHRRWLLEKHMLEQHNIKLWTPMAERQGGQEGSEVGRQLENSKPHNEAPETIKDKHIVNQTEEEIHLVENRKSSADSTAENKKSWLSSVAQSFLSKSKLLSMGAKSSVGISCRLCKSVYKTFGGFRTHVDMHNESKTRFQNKFDCKICNHPNLSEEKLRRHLTKIHETVKNTCNICGKVSQRRGHHENHMLTKHNIKIWTPISEQPKSTNEKEVNDISNDEKNETAKPPSSSIDDEMLSVDDSSLPGNLENTIMGEPEPDLKEKRRRRSKSVQKVQDDAICSAEEDDETGKKDKESDDDWSGAGEVSDIDGRDSASSNDESDDDFKIKSTRKSGGSELYKCKICNSIYKSDRGYQRHKQEHKISKELNHKFDCEDCGFPNSCERKLRYHKKRAHQLIVMIKCKLCSYEALRPNQLRLHMQKHNPSNKRGVYTTGRPRKNLRNADVRSDGKIVCKICKAVYTGPEGYKRHVKDHDESNANNNQFACDLCGFPTLSESRLRRHKSMKHTKAFPTCELCGQTFVRPNLLKSHLKFHEENDGELDESTGNYHCRFCKEGFPSMRGLQTHKLVIHQSEMAATGKCFLCSECGQCFSTVALLRRHVKTKHEKIYRFTCETCGKGFETKHSIECHRLIHKEDRAQEFVCEICGVAYSHKRTLEQHKVKFHPDAVGRKIYSKLANGPAKAGTFKCKYCHIVFPFKYSLLRHIPAVHKELYNFTCDVCSKAYVSASSLRLHKEITHSDGTNKYPCEYCGKLFPHKHYVVCHYRWCRKKQEATKEASTSKTTTVSNPISNAEYFNSSSESQFQHDFVRPTTSSAFTNNNNPQEPEWKPESLSSSFYSINNMFTR